MKYLPQWWKTYFLQVEFGLALLITILFILWTEICGGRTIIEGFLSQNRSDVYSTLAAIFGSLLGFIITSVSIVLGYATSDRLAIVRESKHYSLMWQVFTVAIRVLALATISALIGLMIDRDSHPIYIIFYFNIFIAILAVFRLARCVWVLEEIIKIVTAPPKNSG